MVASICRPIEMDHGFYWPAIPPNGALRPTAPDVVLCLYSPTHCRPHTITSGTVQILTTVVAITICAAMAGRPP